MKKQYVFIAVVVLELMLVAGCAKKTENRVTIKFGVLPVLQALELYVADEKGLFDKAGVEVDLIPFNTAAEKDIAFTAGEIDGYFGDLFTPIVVKSNGFDCTIVASNYKTSKNQRMFGVVGKRGGNYKKVEDLEDVPIAISSNSVIHYAAETLLLENGLKEDKFKTFESKNIGVRMQMLMTGELEAATLPEPLVSAAIAGGANLIVDDRQLDASQTVLVFSNKFLSNNGVEVKKFLKAVANAGELINKTPDAARETMVNNVRLPEKMKHTYPVPIFTELGDPGLKTVTKVIAWLEKKKVVKAGLTYKDVVNLGFLK